MISRFVAGLLSLITVSAAPGRAAEPEVVHLWDGVAPGSEGQTGEEIVRLSDGGERVVSNVHRPSLTVYLPAATTATAPAVLIVPGGGHREIWTDHEGHNVARWLSGRGVAAFILKYRLPRQEGSPYTIEHEVADGQRALRLMRHRAAHWRIDPARTGMIGVSAGGDLVARVAVAAEDGDPGAADPVERQGARPAFQALMYPAHPEVIQPTADAPPAFLCWGFEDFPMIADGMGSVYSRFRDARVPVEMHVYSNAGHGFGLRAKDASPAGKWIDRFHEWLGSRGLLMPQEFNYRDDPRAAGADPAAIARMDALLQSFVDDQKLGSVAGFIAKGGNPDSRFLEEEMLALAKYPLGFDPGTRWNYHVSTNMPGYLIERISGKPLRDYVKETVLIPLGMDDTEWYYDPEALARFVRPYRVVEGKLQPGPMLYSEGAVSEQQTYAEGAIGLNGPIKDSARFCQMLLNRGEFNGHRILKPETVGLMTTINRLPEDSGAEKGQQKAPDNPPIPCYRNRLLPVSPA